MGLPPGFAPVPLARQTQAQFLDRTSGKFSPTQGPSGPGRKRRQALLALRAGNFAELLRSGPRNGGPGVSGPMGTKCPSAASPGDPLVTFPSLGKSLAPQGETLQSGAPSRRALQKEPKPNRGGGGKPPPYRSIENLQGGEISRDSVSRSLDYFPKKIVSSSFCFFLFQKKKRRKVCRKNYGKQDSGSPGSGGPADPVRL